MQQENKNTEADYLKVIAKLINVILILLLIIVILTIINFSGVGSGIKKEEKIYEPKTQEKSDDKKISAWHGPDTSEVSKEEDSGSIRYGRQLISATSFYFGPKGKINSGTNGMNCQNCHLEAGSKAYGNNYGAVASTYPKFRERSGTIETISKRVNDCFQRSLNGPALDTAGKEMLAIVAYIKWLGKDVPKGEKPLGTGIQDISYLERAADPTKGKTIYDLKCRSCHEDSGQGRLNAESSGYQYPPLWGKHSYTNGAGLYRLSRFASYVKYNMPLGTSFEDQKLSEEEAWDVAAFVNSQPRPAKDVSKDWPALKSKPVDHPFGPYADKFSELQHKYGPFAPIASARTIK